MIRRILLAVALLAVLAVQSPAHAQWGMGCGGFGMGGYGMNGYGWNHRSAVHSDQPVSFQLEQSVIGANPGCAAQKLIRLVRRQIQRHSLRQ